MVIKHRKFQKELIKVITDRIIANLTGFQEIPQEKWFVKRNSFSIGFMLNSEDNHFIAKDKAKGLIRETVSQYLKKNGVVYCYIYPDDDFIGIEDYSWLKENASVIGEDLSGFYKEVPIKVFGKEVKGKLYEGWDY